MSPGNTLGVDWLSHRPIESTTRAPRSVEAPRTMRAPGWEWIHEIRVSLPPSYALSAHAYPTLWILDNALEAALSHLGRSELILVAVGAERITLQEALARRTFDFLPPDDTSFARPSGDYLRTRVESDLPGRTRTGGAAGFLDFLIDHVRPMLASEYRMDPNDHGILGFSFGGTFVAFSLFSRPGAFRRYICGSPAAYLGNGAIFALEDRYASEHDDLAATAFFAAGEKELTEPSVNALGCVSSMARLVERLSMREYPSLNLTARVFPGEEHATMLSPLISWGVRSVWGDDYLRANFQPRSNDAAGGSAPD